MKKNNCTGNFIALGGRAYEYYRQMTKPKNIHAEKFIMAVCDHRIEQLKYYNKKPSFKNRFTLFYLKARFKLLKFRYYIWKTTKL